jgi:hypothetical protein
LLARDGEVVGDEIGKDESVHAMRCGSVERAVVEAA